MRESIAGYTDAVLEGAGQQGSIARVAGDLSAVRSLVQGSEDLARVLSDPGVPAPARRGVMSDLLSSRVAEESLRLVTFAVDADRATEFVEDLAWVEQRAVAARDHLVAIGEGPLGRHAAGERLDGYASAVLESLADSRSLGEVEDELFRFLRVIDGNDQLRAVLGDRDVPLAARRGLVNDLLSAKATAETTRLAVYATGVGRARDYLTLLEELVERVAQETNRRVAEVRSAVELDDGQRRRLAGALGRIVGRDVDVRVDVDRRVLGGFVATIGDTVVDGSVRHRLDQLKERLVLPEAGVNIESPTNEGDQPR